MFGVVRLYSLCLVLNPLRVLKLFERVRPEDVELLNMDPKVARPEW